MESVTKQVNKIYNEKNPSTYIKNDSEIISFVENRKAFLLKLKLPPKIFVNSNLVDFGCGMGQNTLVYDHLGANCTLLEYDKFSYNSCKSLFQKYSKNKFEIHNIDLFEFKAKKESYDFVVSNGVAHHTKDPIKNIKICMDSLKPGGFFILGIGNKSGFFQRNLQRYILYTISNNNDDIIKYSKLLFKEHLKRSVKFSGRSIDEVIYDTYLNPKIYCFGTKEILDLFNQNGLSLYSSFQELKFVNRFLETDSNQFKLTTKGDGSKYSEKNIEDIILADLEDITLSNNTLNNQKIINQLKSLTTTFNDVSDHINDIKFSGFMDEKLEEFIKNIKLYKKKVNNLNSIDILNKSHNDIFLTETLKVLNILNKKNDKLDKLNEIKKYLITCKRLFKNVNGVGMNYYVGYKNEK